MKELLKRFYNQTGIKGLLIGMAIVIPVWTWKWSKDDGQFNITMIVIGLVLLLVLIAGEFISVKVKQWRTTKK